VRSVTAIGPVKSDSFRDHHAAAVHSIAGAKQLGGSGIMAQVESHAAGLGVTCRQDRAQHALRHKVDSSTAYLSQASDE
jgi:hypothetical protein